MPTLYAYLKGLEQSGEVSARAVVRCKEAWRALRRAEPGLAEPDAAPGPNGELLMTWDNGRHHFEAKILEGGVIEHFYLDRETSWRMHSWGPRGHAGQLAKGLLAWFVADKEEG